MLTGSVTVHGSRFTYWPNSDLDPTMEINADDIYGIIGAACKDISTYSLIAVHTWTTQSMSLNVADIVVVVTEPTVVSVRDCYLVYGFWTNSESRRSGCGWL